MDSIALHQPWLAKLKALIALGKVKLSAMVVFSGFVGAFVLLPIGYPLVNLVIFVFCSMAITMAANAFNQIIERDIDGLMHRTRNRPLPLGQCQPWEAYIFVGLLACIGGLGLYFFFNALAAFVGLLPAVICFGVHTLKRVSSCSSCGCNTWCFATTHWCYCNNRRAASHWNPAFYDSILLAIPPLLGHCLGFL